MWAFAFYVMAPAPLGWGKFEVDIFRPEHTLVFLSYGFLFNILLVYTYAHLALPPYFNKKSFAYFFLINIAFLAGFTLLESSIDYLYQGEVYARHGYEKARTNYGGWVLTNAIINGLALVGANFYGFSFAYIKEQRLRRRLEKEKLSAELSALKHQVNPHFLFNVLNSLYSLSIKNDDEETARGITQLSEMMRYMLYEANGDKVPLKRELDYLSNYIELQRLRLNEQTRIRYEVYGEVAQRQIAPMILIPFIENACKHGVSTVFPSEIHIFIEIGNDSLFLLVRNPKHPRTGRLRVEEGGIGLQNVEKRLQLYYPQAHKLVIEEDEKTYEVSLSLNL